MKLTTLTCSSVPPFCGPSADRDAAKLWLRREIACFNLVILDRPELERRALEHWMVRNIETFELWCGQEVTQERMNHMSVSFLRHELTPYDDILHELRSSKIRCKGELWRDVSKLTAQRLGHSYPYLSEEIAVQLYDKLHSQDPVKQNVSLQPVPSSAKAPELSASAGMSF